MKKTSLLSAALAFLTAGALAAGCAKEPSKQNQKTDPDVGIPGDDSPLPGHDSLAQDTTPKEGPRLLPVEAYLKTYLQIFGGLTPKEIEGSAKKDALFRAWSDYLGVLGLPDYGRDIGRQPETNPLMLATFERLGIALCDEALIHDWKAMPKPAVKDRHVFAFDMPADKPTQADFAKGFEVMHRTFLGYPAKMARTDRVTRFYGLYNDVVKAHDPKVSKNFTAQEAGWAAVCYGLVRHPELHLY